jgi:hypothetical protein
VRADVDEVPVAEVLPHQLELAAVVEAEEEVLLERLAQVEPEPEPAGEGRLGDAAAPDGQDPAQTPFPPEVQASEDGVERPLQHRPTLPCAP